MKFIVIETYRDGGKWTHTFPSEGEAKRQMGLMQEAHPARTYEYVVPQD